MTKSCMKLEINNITQIINKLTRLLDYVRTKYKRHTTCCNVTPKLKVKSQVTFFMIKKLYKN